MTKTSATSQSFPLILCMWSDPIIIQPHAKYRRKPSSFWRHFGHLVRPQLPGSAQNNQTFSFFSNGLSLIRDADTLQVVGSCHYIRPHAKYRPKRMAGCRRFGHLGRSQVPVSAPKMVKCSFLFFRTASRPFATLIICMWLDHIMIRPHTKYRSKIYCFGRAERLWTPWSVCTEYM
jgi:hypothetical protein